MGSLPGQNTYSVWAFKVSRTRNRRGKQQIRKDALQRWHCCSLDEALATLGAIVRNGLIRGRLRLERVVVTDEVLASLLTIRGDYAFAGKSDLSLRGVDLGAGMEPLVFLSVFPDFKSFDCRLIDLFRPTDISVNLLRWLSRHGVSGDNGMEWDAEGRVITDDAVINFCWSSTPVYWYNELTIRNVNVSAKILSNIIEARLQRRKRFFYLRLHPAERNIDISELTPFGRRQDNVWSFKLPDLRHFSFWYNTDTGEINVHAL